MSQAGNGRNGLNGLNDQNGHSDGKEGVGSAGEKIPGNARRLDHRLVRPNYLPTRVNPEQGCYGCLISVGVILATFLVWVFIYWYNEPVFHHSDMDASPPPPAQTIRRRPQN